MITVSIDVNKIDKTRFWVGKNGRRMMDLILIETPNGKFGNDYMVKQSRTKEEREKGLKPDLPILGNAKIYENKGGGSKRAASSQGTAGEGDDW